MSAAVRLLPYALLTGIAIPLTPSLAPLDDAYIALHSAVVLTTGSDPVYGVPALTGSTSPPHVALLALLLTSGAGPVTAMRIAASLTGAAYLCATWHLSAVAGVSIERRILLAIIAGASGAAWFQATNGLETGFAMATVLMLIAAAATGRLLAVALLAGCAASLRPDLVPAACLLFVWTAWGQPWSSWLRAAVVAGAMALPWPLWSYVQTGHFLPQTIDAKSMFFAEGCLPGSARMQIVGSGVGSAGLLLLPLTLGVLGWGNRLAYVGAGATLATLLAYWFALPGAVYHNKHRYLYPIIVPWLVFGLARIAARPRRELTLVGVLLALVSLWWPRPAGDDSPAAMARELADVGRWVDQHLPDTATLLVHDAGAVSVYADRRAVDLVGLKTPSSLAVHRAVTWPSCGEARGDSLRQIARASNASHLVVVNEWDRIFAIVDQLQPSFTLAPVRVPASEAGYRYAVYALTPKAAGQ
jgi:hypothetical protein